MGIASPPGSASPAPTLQAFRAVPRTGVVYVTKEAALRGYRPGDPAWCNLGQGQPETGPLPGAPDRLCAVAIDPADHEYAPVAGLSELREAVASLYNRLYRRGMPSQYTAENVAISGGGRAALTRAVAALDRVNLGHFLPDYTAYEELLDIFRLVSPIPILLRREQSYGFSLEDLQREVLGRGLSALLGDMPDLPPAADRAEALRSLPVEMLEPGPFQPRGPIEPTPLQELADSIREHGVLQPILV
ncbi:MAG TPA: aminotransferase class I/II-fold pyridoxal phosphate-dependent enzyme, partial [Thermoanaerobaculia bacterium]|nr:aminotransferase class I/II-fold pyridoxal phosphate-dependent enzyme [Thermoanaerobaculia bacterium]